VPTEIYVYGIDREGAIADYFTRALGLDVGEMGATLRQTGLKYWGHLELPPGDYLLRVVVRNDAAGLSGVRKIPLKVPDVRGGEAGLWPPMVAEPAGKWVFGRERPEDQGNFPYPFMIDEQPFIPAARPAVASGAEIPLILAGYNLGPSPSVSGRLYAADGEVVGSYDLPVQAVAGGSGPDRWRASFAPGRLAPGDYRFVLQVAADGGVVQESEIELAIGG
jgi:hypothetical protein